MVESKKMIVVSGKRKSAIARVKIVEGKGQILYNNLPYQKLGMFHKLALSEPVQITEKILGKF